VMFLDGGLIKASGTVVFERVAVFSCWRDSTTHGEMLSAVSVSIIGFTLANSQHESLQCVGSMPLVGWCEVEALRSPF